MWRETIAAAGRRGRASVSRVAGRIVTGPSAFLASGLLDILALARWLVSDRRKRGRLY
jgi:hypothetical protein